MERASLGDAPANAGGAVLFGQREKELERDFGGGGAAGAPAGEGRAGLWVGALIRRGASSVACVRAPGGQCLRALEVHWSAPARALRRSRLAPRVSQSKPRPGAEGEQGEAGAGGGALESVPVDFVEEKAGGQ
jgi:hypothetical protein